jgi:hypothetical protein
MARAGRSRRGIRTHYSCGQRRATRNLTTQIGMVMNSILLFPAASRTTLEQVHTQINRCIRSYYILFCTKYGKCSRFSEHKPTDIPAHVHLGIGSNAIYIYIYMKCLGRSTTPRNLRSRSQRHTDPFLLGIISNARDHRK